MARDTAEILDPVATIETLEEEAASRALNRRNFMAALGVAGAATGAALISTRTSRPKTVSATSFSQADVLNFALNLEYLEATFYSYVTQGTDLPASIIVGSGAVTGAPGKLTFTGANAAQLTDLLNEIYFDELNHVVALRNVLGGSAVARPALNLGAYQTVTANNAISIARIFEDVGVTAYAGAASLLSGANLTYAAQILAVEGFHSGALRLASIQNQAIAPYFPTAANTSFTGTAVSGSKTISPVYFTSVLPIVGQSLNGPVTVTGTTITAVSGANVTFTGNITSGSASVTTLSATTGLAVGQIVTGTGIPAGATILAISGSTLTLSASATATTTKLSMVTGNGSVTISAAALANNANAIFVATTLNDSQDVGPADPGTPAAAALGPVIVNSNGETAGFFATTGSATSNEVNPLGLAFARTTSQVLSIVYATGGIAPNPGVGSGGFFPSGFNGLIKTI